MLVVYPVAVALLIGFAFSRGADKPTVAVFNQVPPDEQIQIGNQRLGSVLGPGELSGRVKTVEVSLARRGQAEGPRRRCARARWSSRPTRVQQGRSRTLEQSQVELIVNEEDPVKGRLVDDTISSVVAGAEPAPLARADQAEPAIPRSCC